MPRRRNLVLVGLVLGCAACGGSIDGTESGAIREAVVEPGVTAIEQAGGLACGADADALRAALETYEMLHGEPAADEAALVSAGFLRDQSQLWDVADGQLVPQDPGCA